MARRDVSGEGVGRGVGSPFWAGQRAGGPRAVVLAVAHFVSVALIGCATDSATLEMKGATPLGASNAGHGVVASAATTAPLPEPRGQHAAALLPTGKVLVFGGRSTTIEGAIFDLSNEYSYLTSTALFDPATETWAAAAPTPQTLTLDAPPVVLQDGRVLAMADSMTLLYDPALDAWTSPAPMPTPRAHYGVAPLPDGRVLVAGGRLTEDPSWPATETAEIYDPVADTWVATTPMSTASTGPVSAVSLLDGRVLVVGSFGHAELYDPVSEIWTQSLPRSARGTRATLLSSGKVIVVGDRGQSDVYDPATNAWTSAGGLDTSGEYSKEVLTPLLDGRALLTGGMWYESGFYIDEDGWAICGVLDCIDSYGFTDAAWLFEPTTQSWAPAPPMTLPRAGHTATLLPSGAVLIAGGDVPAYTPIVFDTTDSVELYTVQTHPGLPPGAPCDADLACTSGACVDGRCCDTPCDEQGGNGGEGGSGGSGGSTGAADDAAGGPDGAAGGYGGSTSDSGGSDGAAGGYGGSASDSGGSAGGSGGSASDSGGSGGSAGGYGGSGGSAGGYGGFGGSAGDSGGSTSSSGGSADDGSGGSTSSSGGSGGSEGEADGTGGASQSGAGGDGGSASPGSGGDPGPGADSDNGDDTGGPGRSTADPAGAVSSGSGCSSCSMGDAGGGHRPWLGALALLGALGLRRKRGRGARPPQDR